MDTTTTTTATPEHPGQMGRGEDNPRSKMTAEDVRTMRREWDSGGVTYRSLADRYGISHVQVFRIIKGQRWAHIAPEEN